MSEPVKPRRRYSSPKRVQQANETRQAILSASRLLFAERGYATTTIDAIAGQAQVAVPTVYAVFRSKRAILFALLDQLLDQAALAETYTELINEPDPRRQLRLAARITRQLMETAGDLLAALRAAGTAEPEFREVWRTMERRRKAGITTFIQALSDRHQLINGMPVQHATDIVWSMISSEMHQLLVGESGWTGEEYEEWLAGALAKLLLR